MGYDPTEPYKVNVPNVNDTNKGLLDIVGPGLPEGWSYGEYQGPYTGEVYDEQGIVPADKEYIESIPEGTYDETDDIDTKFNFNFGDFGKGLMDLANQQSYDYKLF